MILPRVFSSHGTIAAIVTFVAGFAITIDAEVSCPDDRDVSRLVVEGDVAKPLSLDTATLLALGAEDIVFERHGKRSELRGVRLDRVLKLAGVEPGPKSPETPKHEKRSGWKFVVVASARDGFQAAYSFAELHETMGSTKSYLVPVDSTSTTEAVFRIVTPTDLEASRSVHDVRRLTIVDLRKIVPANPQ